MAQIPGLPAKKDADTKPVPAPAAPVPAPAAPVPAPSAPVFEDVEEMPESFKFNPYQDKVNELAKTGKGAAVKVLDEDVKQVRADIRKAANNIEKGATTRVQILPGTGYSRVYFTIGAMAKRPRKS
jgi:hypothetical protein